MSQALKGRGLHLEDTHLVHPERLCVLLTVLSVALVWCCLTDEMHAEDVEIKILKHFRDGALERFVAIFAGCIPRKTRAQLNRNPF